MPPVVASWVRVVFLRQAAPPCTDVDDPAGPPGVNSQQPPWTTRLSTRTRPWACRPRPRRAQLRVPTVGSCATSTLTPEALPRRAVRQPTNNCARCWPHMRCCETPSAGRPTTGPHRARVRHRPRVRPSPVRSSFRCAIARATANRSGRFGWCPSTVGRDQGALDWRRRAPARLALSIAETAHRARLATKTRSVCSLETVLRTPPPHY